MTVDLFSHEPALRLALRLEDRGVGIVADGDDLVLTPSSLLTETDLAEVRQHKPALLLIARICDPEVQRRRERFVHQLPSTANVYEAGWRWLRGICWSCGASVPGWGRCWRCSLAWSLAHRLPLLVEDTRDEQSCSASEPVRTCTGPIETGPALDRLVPIPEPEPEPDPDQILTRPDQTSI